MRVYFIFDIKKQYINLYKDNKFVLFNILKGLYNYSYDDVEMGFNLFNQLTNKIEKDLVDRYLFVKLHRYFPYSKKNNIHYINNLYKDEVSRLCVKNSYISVECDQITSSFFKILSEYYGDFFVCEFKYGDYFFVSDLKTLV